jgi:hypothetical protein
MLGAIHPLPQYAFMAWCSVKKITGTTLPLSLWIDYQSAFDSVPHSWIEVSTELTGVKNKTVKFCKLSTEK